MKFIIHLLIWTIVPILSTYSYAENYYGDFIISVDGIREGGRDCSSIQSKVTLPISFQSLSGRVDGNIYVDGDVVIAASENVVNSCLSKVKQAYPSAFSEIYYGGDNDQNGEFRSCYCNTKGGCAGNCKYQIGAVYQFKGSIAARINMGTGQVYTCSDNEVVLEGKCVSKCKCNENLINGECVAIAPATTWDQTNDLIYEYPDNNHDDAERCEPKQTDEVDGVVNSCSSAGNDTSTTNPIDCATGQKKYTEVDYQGFGLDALTYTRRYETTVEDDSLTFDTTAAIVSTGNGWQTQTPRLVTKTFADGAKAVYFKLGSRIARIFFYPAGSDVYQTNGNMTDISLTEDDGKQVVTLRSGQRYSFNSAGQVASYQPKRSNDDERYTYTWDGELLIKKENRFGRYLSFQYDDQNRLTQLTDQDGVSVYYQYDDAGNLAKVIYPDGTPDDLTDNPFKHYQFGNTAFPNNVTGIVDQDGTQLATIAYNADGKATLSELNNSAERTEVSYPEDGKAIVKFFRDVESDAYRQETYSYAKFRGRYQLTAKTITKCDNCELTTETWDYNDAELLERHTDPAGVITEWAYDSNARKVKTIVAKGTDQEQTTTYTWNETHNAIDTITTKTDVTTYTFDERGNRIATVVTPLQSE